MKPILIDVSKFGGSSALPELQKLVDQIYQQGYNDGARNLEWNENDGSLQAPLVDFDKWMSNEA